MSDRVILASRALDAAIKIIQDDLLEYESPIPDVFGSDEELNDLRDSIRGAVVHAIPELSKAIAIRDTEGLVDYISIASFMETVRAVHYQSPSSPNALLSESMEECARKQALNHLGELAGDQILDSGPTEQGLSDWIDNRLWESWP